MKRTLLALGLPGLLLGAALTLPATPGLAQAADEIVVTGHWRNHVPADAQTASQSISYSDLDISTDWGWHELKHRISLTARYLCDKLGENDAADGLTPSCRQQATRDALDRIGSIHEHYAPRGTAWVRPAPWAPPYGSDWAARYPDDPGY
jgi:UrcA family protein